MRLMQVITDYIRRSILTTRGDLVVRGVALPERLAAGLLNTVLKGRGAGVLPAYLTPSIADIPQDIVVFADRHSGDLVTTALSFAPKLLFIIGRDNTATNMNWSLGWENSSQAFWFTVYNDGSLQSFAIDYSLHVRRNAANRGYGHVTAWTSNGFTIGLTWSGTIHIDVVVLCFG